VEARGEELPKDRIARTREERLDRQKNIDQLQKERDAAREDGDDARAIELSALIKEKLRAENSSGALPAAAGTGGGKGLSPAEREKALADAKRVLKVKPEKRDEVLRRLRAAGIDPAGL
jgi:hypothetical protein